MSRNAEFEAWLGPRWPRLVRTAVLLGVSTSEAETAVEVALSRCHHDWARIRETSDPEAWVLGRVVDALVDVATPLPEAPGRGATGDVRDALKVLVPEDRAVTVLQLYAGLGEDQLVEALALEPREIAERGARSTTALEVDPRALALLARSETASWISVREAPYARIEAMAVRRRRRAWLVGLALLLVAVAVAAALTLGLERSR